MKPENTALLKLGLVRCPKGGTVLFLLGAFALAGSVWAQDIEKADALVGKSVTVQNVYRSSGGVTITKLRSDAEVEAARKALQSALRKYRPRSSRACWIPSTSVRI